MLHGQVPFFQGRDELPAHPAENKEADGKKGNGGQHKYSLEAQRQVQHRGVQPLVEGNDAVGNGLLIGHLFVQKKGCHHGDICKGKYQGTPYGQHDRLRHRLEHLAFYTDQGEDGDIDHQDDDFAKGRRTPYFYGGGLHLLVHLGGGQFFPGKAHLQPVDYRLDDDDCPVHYQPEIYRPQAHQVSGDAQHVHH